MALMPAGDRKAPKSPPYLLTPQLGDVMAPRHGASDGERGRVWAMERVKRVEHGDRQAQQETATVPKLCPNHRRE